SGLYMASTMLLHYDGQRWAEAGFHCAPDGPAIGSGGLTAIDGGVGGGSMDAGTYGYIALYEEIDANGELHQGPTSVQVNVTVAANGSKVLLTIPTYRLTSKLNVRIGVFRSKKNVSDAFYRVTSLDPSNLVATNGFLANNITADSV